jgi:hypothetical protein
VATAHAFLRQTLNILDARLFSMFEQLWNEIETESQRIADRARKSVQLYGDDDREEPEE